MGPEQARGQRDFHGRRDQDSLAGVVYEVSAGQAPFVRTGAEPPAARPTQRPPSLVERRPALPPAAGAVLPRALALAPEARFDTTSAFAEALSASMVNVPRADDRTPNAALDGARAGVDRTLRRRWLV